MNRLALSRRAFGQLLAAGAALFGASRPVPADPLDRGIGGTGAAPGEPGAPGDASDRGIGGTGVIGTIRGFGSIVVNDRHIAYRDDVAVTIDDRPARVSDMRLGHVVSVLAQDEGGVLTAQRIDITHEVVGRIQHLQDRTMLVLGQRIVVAQGRSLRGWRRGDRVAVSGLRAPDGGIVASLIEAPRSLDDRVVGLIEQGAAGQQSIGALPLAVPTTRTGERAILHGRLRNGRFVATEANCEIARIKAAENFSIESLIRLTRDKLTFGAGYRAEVVAVPDSLPPDTTVRALLTARISPSKGLVVDSVRLAGPSGTGSGRGGASSNGPPGTRGDPDPGGPPPGAGHRGEPPGDADRPGGGPAPRGMPGRPAGR